MKTLSHLDNAPGWLKGWAGEHKALGFVLLVALGLRTLMVWLYAPVSYSDTRTYYRLAEQILLGWSKYDGSRTPGYPVFLALTQTEHAAWLAQMGMGVIITLAFYFLGWQIGAGIMAKNRQLLACLAALAHTLNLGQLFFESNLLSETLATFFGTLVVAGWVAGFRLLKARSIWLAAGMGLFCGLAILTRGLFLLLPFWTLLFIGLFWNEPLQAFNSHHPGAPLERKPITALWKTALLKLKATFVLLLSFSIPLAVVLGIWIGFIRTYYNQWGLETISGFRLIQNAGTFFEYAPDEYAVIRDTYLKYRDERVDQTGSQTNVIWQAIPEMMQASGLNFYDLSRTVGKISLVLIREHPDLYLKNVVKGWWYFWRAPVYWSPDALEWQSLRTPVTWLIFLQRVMLFGFNLFFMATSLLCLWAPIRSFFQFSPFQGYLTGFIWTTSVLQAFLDHGDNPRFLIPLQSLVVLWGLWIGCKMLFGSQNLIKKRYEST